jgi:hypothetical protein
MNEETNLDLWDQVRTPDPAHTKGFTRGGGFKGTSTNVTYLVRLATEQFGMNGVGWGFDVDDEKYAEGAPLLDKDKTIIGKEIVHVIRGRIWYVSDGEKHHTSPQFGQTTFVGSNKYGPFTDEEAPKKSISDCMVKCLSLLGFAADIHLGLWDDNKYLSEVKRKYAAKPTEHTISPQKLTDIQEKSVVSFKDIIDSIKDVDTCRGWWAEYGEGVKEDCGIEGAKKVHAHLINVGDVLSGKK